MKFRTEIPDGEIIYSFGDNNSVNIRNNEGKIIFTHLIKGNITNVTTIHKEVLIAMFSEAKFLSRGEKSGKKI